MAPHTMHLRGGVKMGDAKMVDTMMYDALTDAFTNT
jgi:acetyl-CoA C-acetyltransferase